VLSALGIDAEPIRVPPLVLRPAEGQCFVHGRRLTLSRREFERLVALAAAAGHVVPRANLYELLWGRAMPSRRRDVDVYIAKLRSKLGDAAPGWSFIHTHQKFGYRLAPEPLSRRSG
jgi:DNA-binding response OmpR family regulator